MKRLLYILLFLGVTGLNAQGELVAVSVEVAAEDSAFQVRQTFTLDLADSVPSFEIKALEFEGTKVNFLTATLDKVDLVVTDSSDKGMTRLKLSKGEGKSWSEVVCTYEAEVTRRQFYLPLFFTNFSAATSENDFFSMQLRMPVDQNYTLLFPTVKLEESSDPTDKVINLEVPALPAFLRLQRHDGNRETLTLNDTVDLLAVFLFLGIGLLIWVNRKRLSYG